MNVADPAQTWSNGNPIAGYCDVWDKYCVVDRPTYEHEFAINLVGYSAL